MEILIIPIIFVGALVALLLGGAQIKLNKKLREQYWRNQGIVDEDLKPKPPTLHQLAKGE